eukprot:TRINITY_DN16124_c0_g1_i1.p1 TRINITY_DN16124_c0_g1~~TRINITY_DN16124_c0_g1_i1.p1  ORF type:complete len:894 (+),score=200.40 TRINITY_DN16124_c0_g1_i1:119-2800(+)
MNLSSDVVVKNKRSTEKRSPVPSRSVAEERTRTSPVNRTVSSVETKLKTSLDFDGRCPGKKVTINLTTLKKYTVDDLSLVVKPPEFALVKTSEEQLVQGKNGLAIVFVPKWNGIYTLNVLNKKTQISVFTKPLEVEIKGLDIVTDIQRRREQKLEEKKKKREVDSSRSHLDDSTSDVKSELKKSGEDNNPLSPAKSPFGKKKKNAVRIQLPGMLNTANLMARVTNSKITDLTADVYGIPGKITAVEFFPPVNGDYLIEVTQRSDTGTSPSVVYKYTHEPLLQNTSSIFVPFNPLFTKQKILHIASNFTASVKGPKNEIASFVEVCFSQQKDLGVRLVTGASGLHIVNVQHRGEPFMNIGIPVKSGHLLQIGVEHKVFKCGSQGFSLSFKSVYSQTGKKLSFSESDFTVVFSRAVKEKMKRDPSRRNATQEGKSKTLSKVAKSTRKLNLSPEDALQSSGTMKPAPSRKYSANNLSTSPSLPLEKKKKKKYYYGYTVTNEDSSLIFVFKPEFSGLYAGQVYLWQLPILSSEVLFEYEEEKEKEEVTHMKLAAELRRTVDAATSSFNKFKAYFPDPLANLSHRKSFIDKLKLFFDTIRVIQENNWSELLLNRSDSRHRFRVLSSSFADILTLFMQNFAFFEDNQLRRIIADNIENYYAFGIKYIGLMINILDKNFFDGMEKQSFSVDKFSQVSDKFLAMTEDLYQTVQTYIEQFPTQELILTGINFFSDNLEEATKKLDAYLITRESHLGNAQVTQFSMSSSTDLPDNLDFLDYYNKLPANLEQEMAIFEEQVTKLKGFLFDEEIVMRLEGISWFCKSIYLLHHIMAESIPKNLKNSFKLQLLEFRKVGLALIDLRLTGKEEEEEDEGLKEKLQNVIQQIRAVEGCIVGSDEEESS